MTLHLISYGSICSGIEAASIAWEPLGLKASWFAQFDPDHNYKNGPDFPSAVLAYRWPEVQNLGDMTKIAAAVRAGTVEAPDIGVGGTPCQAFSVAGARAGLADPRGQLTIAYVDLADAIDESRLAAGKEPAIFVWENVPGVLSSKDNAFGAFLGLLAGEDCELQPPGKKWSNVGYVRGPKRTIAWRILDAQYFGVAQRRRRVFVVASARTDIDPAKILFESESVRRDIAPSRSAREIVAAFTANGVGACGADDNQAQAGHLIPQTIITGAFRMRAFGEYADDETASTVKARDYKDATDLAVLSVHGTQDPDTLKDMAHTLGRNHGQENAVIAFSSKDNGQDATNELSPTLRACNSVNSNQNAGGPPAVAYPIHHGVAYGFKGGQGAKAGGIGYAEEQSPTLTSANSGSNLAPTVMRNLTVRRLTPIECERLQGFPDNHTLIPTNKRKKITAEEYLYLRHHSPNITAEEAYRQAVDGPRYKAIGNSMAVPVMQWIGKRIIGALEGKL